MPAPWIKIVEMQIGSGVFGVQTDIIQGLPSIPKGVQFWATNRATAGESANAKVHWGYSTGPSVNHSGYIASDDNGAGTTNCGRAWSNTNCIAMASTNGTAIDYSAKVSSFGTTGGGSISIDVTNSAGANRKVMCKIYGGDGVECEGAQFTLDSTKVATNTEDFALTMAAPDALIFGSSLKTGTNENFSDDVHFSHGITDMTNQFVQAGNSEHDQGTSDSVNRVMNDNVLVRMNVGSTTIAGEASIESSQPATGFRLTYNDQFGGNFNFFVFAVKGYLAHVGDYNSSSSSGLITSEQAACSHTPLAVFAMSSDRNTYGAGNDVHYSCGITDVTLNLAHTTAIQDAAGTADTSSRYLNTDFINNINFNGDDEGRQDMSSFQDEGFIVDQNNGSGNTNLVQYLSLGIESVGVDNLNLHGNLKGNLIGGFQ